MATPHTRLSKANPPAGIQAAMYVRMSTERQNYSTNHQRDRIREYATAAGMKIIHEYADEGKSGLDIKGRHGLQALIGDVVSGRAIFTTLLVLDVSRWGRFQDVDESAHYEYICRNAGITVVYCAEQFDNDGSPLASLLKSIKRTMAAEYSRELSDKVFRAMCGLANTGFKPGGTAGYGLRRMLVGADGEVKRTLLFGDRKGPTTDRVIFAPGPPAEIATVLRVYTLYVQEKMTRTDIAGLLNSEGIKNEFGKQWTLWSVKNILTNEKYIGNVVFNRRSFKLKTKLKKNPPASWVRRLRAFPSIVPIDLFNLAQEERCSRANALTNVELLTALQSAHASHGSVTAKVLRRAGLPDPKVFARRFGTLAAAYAEAGIPKTKFSKGAETRLIVETCFKRVLAEVNDIIATTPVTNARGKKKGQLILNGDITLNIVAVRARHASRNITWRIPIATVPPSDFILCAQLDCKSGAVTGYLLLPTADFKRAHLTLEELELPLWVKYRHESLTSVFGVGIAMQ